jgi:hypothetical protein
MSVTPNSGVLSALANATLFVLGQTMRISQDTRDEFLLVNGNWHCCLAYAGISVAWW